MILHTHIQVVLSISHLALLPLNTLQLFPSRNLPGFKNRRWTNKTGFFDSRWLRWFDLDLWLSVETAELKVSIAILQSIAKVFKNIRNNEPQVQ